MNIPKEKTIVEKPIQIQFLSFFNDVNKYMRNDKNPDPEATKTMAILLKNNFNFEKGNKVNNTTNNTPVTEALPPKLKAL